MFGFSLEDVIIVVSEGGKRIDSKKGMFAERRGIDVLWLLFILLILKDLFKQSMRFATKGNFKCSF